MIEKINLETGELLEEKPDSKQNKDFVMLYRRYINQIAELGSKDTNALKVLLFFKAN